MSDLPPSPLSWRQRFLKRGFDILFALVGLLLTGWLLPILLLGARISTSGSGLYRQTRIGRLGRPFVLYKIRTMRADSPIRTTVTTTADPRITRFGAVLRRYKLDELPQLWNILSGDMSFVGPRPDVAGFADALTGDDRIILAVRPGVTGPATLKYRREEDLLATAPSPEELNRTVIFPDKVSLNRAYVESYSFLSDVRYLLWTVSGGPKEAERGST